ncbi:hypothetical protein [Mucilaginibacter sp.]|uniref:hypothetical protein n=1 Tax=Mucilaginibacter sp. TaxID=1882438 RepID=UPI0025D0A5A7|nr:hypothetical protein [Mucilaginibacter sp.]
MGISDFDEDPAFRYESLAREAFDNCGKWGDPWGYAAQDVYNEFIEEPTTVRGKKILDTILVALILKHKGVPILDSLKDIQNTIADAQSQNDVIVIVDNTIELLRSLD